MKHLLSILALAALLTTTSFGAEDKKYTAGSCCDKAKKEGKACTHKCCVEAEKKGEVCKKCNKE